MNCYDDIKLFGITNQLLEYDLDRIEEQHGFDLKRNHISKLVVDQTYYPD
jgi:hypothetical protein